MSLDPSEATAMEELPPVKQRGQATWREILVVGAGLLVFLAGVILGSGARVGFTRWYWLDEVCTVLVARQDVRGMIHLLKEGVDSNLPGLYGFFAFLRFFGLPMTEVPLRAVAGVAMWLSLVGLYANLRLAYPRAASLAATLSLLTAAALFRFTFEVRFYSYWMMFLMWENYFLYQIRTRDKDAFSWRHVVLILLTAMNVLIHYYGILALCFLLAADFVADARRGAVKIKARWPVYCGLLVLPVVPYFFYHQHGALSGGVDLERPTLNVALRFLGSTLLGYPLMGLAGVATVWWLVTRDARMLRMPKWRQLKGFGPAGLVGLLGFPVLLVVLAWCVQPRLAARYGIPGLAGGAVIAAALCSRLPRYVNIAVIAVFAAGAFWQFHRIPGETRAFQGGLESDLRAIAARKAAIPVLFESRFEFYPCVFYHPELAARFWYLEADTAHEDLKLLPYPRSVLEFEAKAHAPVAREFPAYQAMQRDRADELPAFYFFAAQFRKQEATAALVEDRFKGYRAEKISEDVYSLIRAF